MKVPTTYHLGCIGPKSIVECLARHQPTTVPCAKKQSDIRSKIHQCRPISTNEIASLVNTIKRYGEGNLPFVSKRGNRILETLDLKQVFFIKLTWLEIHLCLIKCASNTGSVVVSPERVREFLRTQYSYIQDRWGLSKNLSLKRALHKFLYRRKYLQLF